jgi:hypothetical protein
MASLLYVAVIPACLITYALRKKNKLKYPNNMSEEIMKEIEEL